MDYGVPSCVMRSHALKRMLLPQHLVSRLYEAVYPKGAFRS